MCEELEHSGLSSTSSHFTLIPRIHQTVMAPWTDAGPLSLKDSSSLAFNGSGVTFTSHICETDVIVYLVLQPRV